MQELIRYLTRGFSEVPEVETIHEEDGQEFARNHYEDSAQVKSKFLPTTLVQEPRVPVPSNQEADTKHHDCNIQHLNFVLELRIFPLHLAIFDP